MPYKETKELLYYSFRVREWNSSDVKTAWPIVLAKTKTVLGQRSASVA